MVHRGIVGLPTCLCLDRSDAVLVPNDQWPYLIREVIEAPLAVPSYPWTGKSMNAWIFSSKLNSLLGCGGRCEQDPNCHVFTVIGRECFLGDTSKVKRKKNNLVNIYFFSYTANCGANTCSRRPVHLRHQRYNLQQYTYEHHIKPIISTALYEKYCDLGSTGIFRSFTVTHTDWTRFITKSVQLEYKG